MNESSHESIRRVFTEVFSARDIAEPLVSFDGVMPVTAAAAQMDESGFDVVGVRDSGLVSGYIERADLSDGCCGEHRQDFDLSQVIPDSATLAEVVQALGNVPRLFVKTLGVVGGIVTRSDLEKPAVRMWLFGMVALIEVRFTRMIERFCPDDQWREYLSPGRLQKAETLRAERQRRSQRVRLIDCLQFSDKGQVLARNPDIRQLTQFNSRRQVEEAFKSLERLRNNLAHSQDIVTGDWDTILRLAENLDRVIRGPAGLEGEITA